MQIANWVGLKSEKSAQQAIHLSALMAIGSGFYIAYLVHMTRIHSMPLPFHRSAESSLDVIAFLLVAIGIFCKYRAAAFFAIIFLIWDQRPVFMSGSSLYQGLIIVIGLIFLRGLFAAFIYSKISPVVYEGVALEKICNEVGASQISPEKKPTKTPLKIIYTGVFVAALLVILGLFWQFTQSDKTDSYQEVKTQISADALAPDQAVFELLTGETVHGKILFEDAVYFQVKIGEGERILIKEDIKKVELPENV